MRLTELQPDAMSPEQRRVVENVTAGKRGRVPAPMRAWLHSPVLADRAQSLGEFLRYDTSLGPALCEFAILITARFWTSHYEWYAHKKLALQAGLDPALIDAIARRDPPRFPDEKTAVIYDYARSMHEKHGIEPALHNRAVDLLGERGVVELVGVLGYYTMVSMTLNGFGLGLPEGETEELQP